MDVDQLLTEISESLFQEWWTDYLLRPWGADANDLHFGVLASLTEACHRTKGKVSPPARYMPYADPPKRRRQSTADMKAEFAKAKKGWPKRRKK